MKTNGLVSGCLVITAVLTLAARGVAEDRGATPAREATTSIVSDAQPIRSFDSLFRFDGADHGVTVLGFDPEGLAAAHRAGHRFRVVGFPVSGARRVDLSLEPFNITTDSTRFVVGVKDGPDRPFDFDPTTISLFRGRVVDHAGSDVFLAVSARRVVGHVSLSLGERFNVAAGIAVTASGAPTLRVFRDTSSDALSPGVPLCGVEGHAGVTAFESMRVSARTDGDATASGGPFAPRTRRIQLALETDYELFQLFGDLTATSDYLVELFGAINHVYLRDVNAYFEIVYVRLWDDPNDLFNESDPLAPFRDYWNANMGAVVRDVAHFASGRRNVPYGGVAYVGAICFPGFAYGLVGYLQGSFPDPSKPSSGHYDIGVISHELGHNCGASHTHNLGIDTCDDFNGVPQRGTIMSYCGQTYSGAGANKDHYFHSTVQSQMESFLTGTATCLVDDCNQNGVADSTDIFPGASLDVDGNGVPDECDDCDNDGTLNSVEIAGGSLDLNSNGIPDECEADCNSNGVPDDRDIQLGATDAYGNIVPDECETDCDNNSVSDFTQIQLDMSLDVNRNALLDACEDCNSNAIPDLDELEGSWNLWAASLNADGAVRAFHADVGVRARISEPGHVSDGIDLLISPSRRIFVASAITDSVIEFDRFGAYVADFVAASSGGLDYPAGLAFMPGGDLLVSSRNTNTVIRYNGSTGALVGTFVAFGISALSQPYGLTYGPNGNLFVTSGGNGMVLEYDGVTGAYIGEYVSSGDNGGLSGARGLVFKPDGNLLVTSFNTNQVLEFAAGTGTFVGQFYTSGTPTVLAMNQPWGIRIGPNNGQVFVARHDESLLSAREDNGNGPEHLHLNVTRVYMLDIDTGGFIRSFITGNDTGMMGTTGFDFMPGDLLDCNGNFVLDECDILQGTSLDTDLDGRPDECPCPSPGAPGLQIDPLVKNRFLTFIPTDVGPDTALRVTFDNLDGFPGSNGQVRWVGPPAPYSDVGGNPVFNAAGLQCTPYYANWSGISLLHVYGEGVVPSSSYSVESVTSCGAESGVPVQLTTRQWGDVVEPFGGGAQPNFQDISAVVGAFSSVPGSVSKNRAALVPSLVDPGNDISFADISACADAFSSAAYPFAGPTTCP